MTATPTVSALLEMSPCIKAGLLPGYPGRFRGANIVLSISEVMGLPLPLQA